MTSRIELYRRYLKASGALEIARRLFVMNAFDGVLTIMGVVLGAYLSGVQDSGFVITAGVGGSIAMGISGMSGAYMAERAERMRDIRKLESAMLRDLDGTHVVRAFRTASIAVALVDGLSPAIAALLLISPFLLVPMISMSTAAVLSLALGLVVLFLLGLFLARISEEVALISGLKMLLVGVLTIIIVRLVVSPNVL
ncbi:MAG: VIT1/CCC1 transporter family protein [Methanothrix sp.]|uniref:VIT1/CCC1 transporter family protein n=1 Tax=Methanothrix sp. TaxID=90426 RepID=UPI0025F30EF6|nr:VIT1/CCC1 transporter family protein [Methanothrix sp.]MCQ8903966.1 VIT1/CCC1 transporter family protein [Methanothrix sp.]